MAIFVSQHFPCFTTCARHEAGALVVTSCATPHTDQVACVSVVMNDAAKVTVRSGTSAATRMTWIMVTASWAVGWGEEPSVVLGVDAATQPGITRGPRSKGRGAGRHGPAHAGAGHVLK